MAKNMALPANQKALANLGGGPARPLYTNRVDWRMLQLLLGRYRRGGIGGRQGDREIMLGRNRTIIRGQRGIRRIIIIGHK